MTRNRAMRAYEDFVIRIGPKRDDGYAVAVTKSPGGTGSGILRLTFDINDVSAATRDPSRGSTVDSDRHVGPARPSGQEGLETGIGCALFDALFTGDVLTLFDRGLGKVSERRSVLRIKISMNLDDPAVTPLAGLPWERLCRWNTREYLSQSPHTTIVRYLDVVQSYDVPAFVPPLRILMVAANPRRDLQLDEEVARIEKELESARGFEIDFLPNATYQKLENRLHEEDYHILHFMGHGDFDGKQGGLVFEDGLVLGTDLGLLLRREPETRLVLLNACSTARVTNQEGQDPFTGVAAALVMAGTPAVVAMQFRISDTAAIAFAGRFYKDLAAGQAVETAVTAGRMAIKGAGREKMEWATPVLFLQAAAENLFSRPSRTAYEAPVRSADELRLQPYMVDRAKQLDHLTLAIKRQLENRDMPLVCIVHGDNEQCQTAFRDRLRSEELPRMLGLKQKRESVKTLHLAWPKEFQERTTFHELLTWKLAEITLGYGEASPMELRDSYLTGFPAVMIHSTVYSSEWRQYPRTLIEDYVAYWQQWPRSPAQRLIILLLITYQLNSGLSWFKKQKQARLHDDIERHLQGYALDAFEGVTFRVLPRLGNVTYEDAERWADNHGHEDLKLDIKKLYTARSGMQMDELTRYLRQLLDRKYAKITEGVA